MSYAETLLPEFDHEMANTRKVLERIPDDKLDWQAHPKSNTIGWKHSGLTRLWMWSSRNCSLTCSDHAIRGFAPRQLAWSSSGIAV